MKHWGWLIACALLACTSRDEAGQSARRYMGALGIDGGVYCAECLDVCDCTLARADGSLVAIECDSDDCRLAKPSGDVVPIPVVVPVSR